jgi:TonB family protein
VAEAQNPPRVHHPILDKVVEAYTNVRSYQVEAVVTIQRKGTATSRKPAPQVVSIAYSAPDRLRLESNNQPAVTVFHDRGASTYSKRSGNNRDVLPNIPDAVNDSPHRRDAMARIGFADYTSIEDGMESASVLRQENVVVEGRSVPCSVVEASYAHGVKRTFWVETARNVVLREVDLGSGDGTELEHTIAVRKLIWNQPLASSLFAVNPPVVGTRGDGVSDPVALVRCQQPAYTEEARIAHLAGYVTMSLTIDDDGMPNDVHVVTPLGLGLDESAVSCMGKSRYSPARKDGKPVPLKMNVSLGFQEHWDSDWYLGSAVFQTVEGVLRPVFVKAKYPGVSQDRRSATVCLHLIIGKEGVPREIAVAAPQDPKLDEQALAIANGWRFQPGTKNGKPVDVPATFTLIHGVAKSPAAGGRGPE